MARSIVVISLLMFCLSGCVCLGPDAAYTGPKPIREGAKEQFSYEPVEPKVIMGKTEQAKNHTKETVVLKLGQNRILGDYTITVDVFRPRGRGKHPLIVTLPILGGKHNTVANIFARHFADHGFAAAIIHRQKKYKKVEVGLINEALKQMVIDHKRALDWLETLDFVDPGQIGVFGISMGGIKASLLMATEPRLKAGVLALAGGDLPYIITHSTEKGLVKRRDEYLAQNNIDLRDLEAELEKIIDCDPIHYASAIDARRVLMILAAFDKSVPFAKGVELMEAIGKPKRVYIPTGHYTAILYIPFVEHAALEFFKKQLNK